MEKSAIVTPSKIESLGKSSGNGMVEASWKIVDVSEE